MTKKLVPFTLDINPEFQKALSLMEGTHKNIFVTGRAGTGKSTLLQHFRMNTQKKLVVLAPTGVAALNVQGQTIHSFFGFKPSVTLQDLPKKIPEKLSKLLEHLDAIVIDEISMVRADLLDCIDRYLQKILKIREPFGGVQMIFIGDLYQLPPVVGSHEKEIFKEVYETPYFFSAEVFAQTTFEMIELEKMYRQSDEKFISILNAIRNNTPTFVHLKDLNTRYVPVVEDYQSEDFAITLTSTNAQADSINAYHLKQLLGKAISFEASIMGDFHLKDAPTAEFLTLKPKAQVMFLNNDSAGRWVNGTLGVVKEIHHAGSGEIEEVIVVTEKGTTVEVTPHTWEIFEYHYNQGQRSLESNTLGSFTQFPLRLAWAVTIHKSQGKTFDRVIIDIGRGTFAHGQMYVALSRCRTLEGLTLCQEIQKRHIIMDWKVVKFLTQFQYKKSTDEVSFEDKIGMIEDAIRNEKTLKIIYLKASDVKSKREIKPFSVGEMEYLGKKYLGVEAFCLTRKENRVFRVDRILEMELE